jgi:hypothetical protein
MCRTWYSRYAVGVDVASERQQMQPWRSACIRSRLLGGTLGNDSTEQGTRYPVSHENCRKRIRLRRHLFRRSSTSEVPSFAALAVHAMGRLGRSRSVVAHRRSS